jgi:uncharacterized membrane protein YphA (DoxX/SURF4 family)
LKTDWPIRIVVATWLIQVAITYPAWFGGQAADNCIFDWYHPIVVPILSGLFTLSLISLLVFSTYQKQSYFSVILFLAILFACNPHLLQPWQYAHAIILGALIFNTQPLLTLALGGLYFWSGLNKLNPWFYDEVFCWFFSPFSSHLPSLLAYVIPLMEMLSGILLLFYHTQRSAALFCICKHVLIATLLSPFFLDWNWVVIPWNICLAVLLYLIYIKPVVKVAHVQGALTPYLTFAFVWIAPAFWYINLWPTSLSFHLYSGYHSEAYLILENKSHDLNAIAQNVYGLPLNLSENTIQSIHQKIVRYIPDAEVLYVYKVPGDGSKRHAIYTIDDRLEK